MKNIFLSLVILLYTLSAYAASAPASFTYQGIVMNSAGTAPLTSVVSLKLSIYDPSGTCLLYQEQQANIDLSQTNGTFAIQVGSSAGATKRTSSDQGLSMTSVFANNGQILATSTTNCTAGYTPTTNDGRLLRVAVTNGGSTVTITPDIQINSVPNAMVAETLQGQTPANLTPPGSVITYAGATCPSGFLTTDGSSYLISQYPNLANSLKSGSTYLWGSADSTHFNVPDFRGTFLRGIDNMGTAAGNAGKDTDGSSRIVGSYQADQLVSHNHAYQSQNQGARATYSVQPVGGGGVDVLNTVTGNTGGTETRSKNYGVMYCIKN